MITKPNFYHLFLVVSLTALLSVFTPVPGYATSLLGSIHTHATPQWSVQTEYPFLASSLESISCISSEICFAVGKTPLNAAGNPPTGAGLYETANGGSTWSNDTASIPSSVGSLDAISCVSASFCEAVGYSYNGTTNVGVSLTYNGSAWILQNMPSTITSPFAISCTSSSFCMAVGDTFSSSLATNIAAGAVYNGSTWSTSTLPSSDTSSESELLSVSCIGTSSEFCVAGGTINTTSTAIAAIYNGGTWSSQSLPSQQATNGEIEGLSCASETFCMAVGNISLNTQPFIDGTILSYNGSSWSGSDTPISYSSNTVPLYSTISCTSVSFCEAGGSSFSYAPGGYSSNSAIGLPYSGTWDTEQTVSFPNSPYNSSLNSISCISQSFCVALGTSNSGGNSGGTTYPPNAFLYNGSGWTTLALPSSTINAPNGISCVTTTFCEAVGSAVVSNATVGVGLSWNGSTWSEQTLPSPASNLFGISCVTTTFCEAVGYSSSNPIAFSYNGTVWTAQTLSSLGANDQLTSVSCVTTTFCEAVGYSSSNPIAFSYNGTVWTAQTLSSLGANATLNSVSCTSSSFCMAVGYAPSASPSASVVLSWNGSSWTLDNNTPTGANAVSCILSPEAQTFCELVGNNSAAEYDESENAWYPQALPVNISGLDEVSCTGPGFCEAIGNNNSGNSPISLSLNGSTWSKVSFPSSVTSVSDALSCISSSTLSAVCETSGITNSYAGLYALSVTALTPLVGAINPNTGSVRGGTLVTISGNNFSTATGSTSVYFGPKPATDVFCSSTTTCSVVSPSGPGLGGTLPVTVRTSSGTSNVISYSYNPTINWSSFPPTRYPSQSYLFTGISCATTGICFGVASNGPHNDTTVFQTTNGGSTWINDIGIDGIPTNSSLRGISCIPPTGSSNGFCQVVGYVTTLTGASTGIAFSWNGTGTTWTNETLPSGITGLYAVACVSSTYCQAVGSSSTNDIILLYNGTAWTVETTLSISPDIEGQLSTISCTSTSFCQALGGNTQTTVIAYGYNGTNWASEAIPFVETGSIIRSISCTSPTFCQAVGSYHNGTSNPNGPLSYLYNGTSWSNETLPSGFLGTNSIWCSSESYCQAVGANADFWNGTTWSTETIPANTWTLSGIWCASVSSCLASGAITVPNSGDVTAAIFPYNGTAWSSVTPPFAISGSYRISCVSSSFCLALGTGDTPLGIVEASVSWNGTSWTNQTLFPSSNSGPYEIDALTCVSQTFCEAVGSYYTTTVTAIGTVTQTQTNGIALSWNGKNWTIETLPSTVAPLEAISCVSQTFCEAVGGSPSSSAIALSWNGTAWTTQTLSSGISPISTISCVSTTFCKAGTSTTPVILSYNGSGWTTDTLPSSFDSLNPEGIDDVLCISSSYCFATPGTYSGSSGGVLFWNGTSWTNQPTGGVNSTGKIMCLSVGACTIQNSLTLDAPFWQPLAVNYLEPVDSTDTTCVQTVSECFTLGADNVGLTLYSTVLLPPPTLTSISPSQGPASGGNTVTLAGTNFSTAPGSTTVLFGSTPATSVSCSTTSSCTAIVPPAPSGATLPDTVDVSVTVSGATSDWTAYTYLSSTPQVGTNYYPLVPYRICDTRTPQGSSILKNQCNVNGPSPLGGGQTMQIQVSGYKSPYLGSGESYVPSNATSVVLNITAVDPTGPGYLTVWPAGEVKPTASSLNYTSGQTVPNLTEVALGTTTSCTGCISIYSYASSDVVVDVEGYYGPASGGTVFSPITPYRVCDTRSNNPSKLSGYDLSQCEGKTLGPSKILNVEVGGTNPCSLSTCPTSGGVPTTAVAAVLNVTAISPTEPGYLTVWPEGATQPTASNLNFAPNQTVPNVVIVPLPQNGDISIYNFSGTTDVAVDVMGYFSSSTTGISFVGTTPYRACDTRTVSSVGYATGCSSTPLSSSVFLTLSLAGMGPIPSNAKAVVLNVTAVNPTADAYLTVWPEGTAQPVVSNLNFSPGLTVANSVTVKLSASGKISIGLYQGSVNVVVDVTGWYS